MARVKGKQCKTEQDIRAIFMTECWSYLRDNFYKFSDANKLKVALELARRNIPQEITGDFRPIVQMPAVTINGKELEFKVGEPINKPAGDTEDTSEVNSDNNGD